MNDYIEVRIDMKPCPGEDATDLMAGLLGDIGYESFVADSDGLTAYIKDGDFNAKALDEVLDDFPFECELKASHTFVAGRDWNEEWERNYFKPILIGDRCVVHSTFHTDVPRAEYDIVIDPKMAFGTGHHSTTSLMLRRLLDMPLQGRSVIDMGTGTGILALLAAMRGAAPVTGIEIDPFAYVNAVENAALNGHAELRLIEGDASVLEALDPADVFIANINRNVITGDIASYAARLKPGGTMLLSGFYVEDIPCIEAAAAPCGLETVDFTEDNNWACLKLQRR